MTQVEDTNTINYGYDLAGQLTSASYPDLPLSWTYDDAGNRLTETRNSVTTNYTNNAANEMTDVGGSSLKYDSAWNMASATVTGATTATLDKISLISAAVVDAIFNW